MGTEAASSRICSSWLCSTDLFASVSNAVVCSTTEYCTNLSVSTGKGPRDNLPQTLILRTGICFRRMVASSMQKMIGRKARAEAKPGLSSYCTLGHLF